tara:strand:- start:162 stop:860 length:699 start_codon:yes stop_codon:yes gene_type:complete
MSPKAQVKLFSDKELDISSRTSTIILISGYGTNLQAILDEITNNHLPIKIISVLSDNPEAYGIKRAKNAGIPTKIINYHSFKNKAGFHLTMEKNVKKINPDLVILAGYMRILSEDFCRQFIGKILNIHPSLLPKFRGFNTYQRVLDSGDEFHGSTVHFVTAELDSGPLVLQYRTKIRTNDDPKKLRKRVQHGEYQIYPMAIRWFAEGSLKMIKGKTVLNGKRISKPKILEET